MYQVCCNSMLIDLIFASQVGFICVTVTNLEDATVIITITIIRFVYSNEIKSLADAFSSLRTAKGFENKHASKWPLTLN